MRAMQEQTLEHDAVLWLIRLRQTTPAWNMDIRGGRGVIEGGRGIERRGWRRDREAGLKIEFSKVD